MNRRVLLAVVLVLPGAALAARPHRGHQEKSWNRDVSCTPFTSTAADVVAGRIKPGIGNPSSTTPPCEIRHKSPFVMLHGMRIIGGLSRVCADGDTLYCDTVFTAEDPVAPAAGQKPVRIRCVIDREWKRAAIAPADPGREDAVIEIQGYAYQDPATHLWEIHPVTAWRAASGVAEH